MSETATPGAAAEFAGEAGPRGAGVRSDCWIGLRPASSGGVRLQLASTVEPYYGDSIRTLLLDGLEHLGLEHVEIVVEDGGAYPFVLMARLEAAARRACPELEARWLPEASLPADGPSARERLRRSRLYLPGDQPKYMLNAGLHAPDGVILDLEDSVAPPSKDAARLLVRNALRQVDFGAAERMVRINQGQLGLADLDEIAEHGLQLVLLPKVEEPDEVRRADDRIRARTDRVVHLMPIIESALGVMNALEIARASERVVALTIGLEDYTADLGVPRTDEGRESLWARCAVVNAARAAGLQAIDSVYSDVEDMDGLRASVREAKALGFEGKGCIHPRQIRVVHEALAPAATEIEKACRIVRAFRQAEARGLGVVSLGSKMIDPPVVKRAHRTVSLAVSAGRLKADWEERQAE